ncbi:MAG: DUF92 domain-containing protein, partial [Planctomycetota bacterium]
WQGWLLLLVFFVAGSAATRAGYARKERIGAAQRARGARGAREALANTGVALLLALAGLFWELPWLPFAVGGAFATALADTAASELGPIWGRRTVHPLTLRRVAPGSEGGISLEGTLAGTAGALLVAAAAAATGWLPPESLWILPLAGTLASYAESVLGAWKRAAPWRQNELLNLMNTALGAALAVLFGGVGGALP